MSALELVRKYVESYDATRPLVYFGNIAVFIFKRMTL